MKARVPGFRRYASGLTPLVLAGCASVPMNDSSRPVLTLQAEFTEVWASSIEVLGAERLLERCVLALDEPPVSEAECPRGAPRTGAVGGGDEQRGSIGVLGTEWTGVDPSGLNCGTGNVFAGHQAQFEVTVSEVGPLITTVRVIGTYRARAAGAESGDWSACASNGELERMIRSRILRNVEGRQS